VFDYFFNRIKNCDNFYKWLGVLSLGEKISEINMENEVKRLKEKLNKYKKSDIIFTTHAEIRAFGRGIDLEEVKENIINPARLVYVKMQDFKFDYDEENDSLFVYLEGYKSKGAVEIGDFVFDFDGKGNLVAMEIFNASEILKIVLSRMIELAKIKEFKIEIFNFRNNRTSIRFSIDDGIKREFANIIIPRINEKSPALQY